MTYTLIHNSADHQYEYHINGHVAYIKYEEQNGKLLLTSTLVPEELSGKGLAKMLLEDVLEQIKKDNKTAIAICSYIVRYHERHPEVSHLSI